MSPATLLPIGVIAASAICAVTLAAARAQGELHFASDPVSVVALGGAAAVVATLAARAFAAGDRRFGWWLAAASIALVGYLALGAAATAAHLFGWPSTELAVGLWGGAWILPLTLAQVCALEAVQRSGSARRSLALAGLALVTALGYAATQQATDPFVGVATIAPEAWAATAVPLAGVVFWIWMLSLLAPPALLLRAAITSSGQARTRLGFAALAALLPVIAVVVCLLLAVARNPGALDPATGSVAFLVTLALSAAIAALAAVLARRGAVDRPALRSLTLIVVGGFAGVAAIAVGVLAASALGGAGAVAVAVVCAAITAAVIGLAWWASAVVLRGLTARTPVEQRIPSLSAREQEVLSLLAEGASNAGIAAALFISDRTVDAHLRSIFTKLDLDSSSASNRRVQAARVWLQRAS